MDLRLIYTLINGNCINTTIKLWSGYSAPNKTQYNMVTNWSKLHAMSALVSWFTVRALIAQETRSPRDNKYGMSNIIVTSYGHQLLFSTQALTCTSLLQREKENKGFDFQSQYIYYRTLILSEIILPLKLLCRILMT